MKIFLMFFLTVMSLSALHAQTIKNDLRMWDLNKIEGSFDQAELEMLENPLSYSFEVEMRLKDNIHYQYDRIQLKPMVGYKLEDGRSIWAGFTYIPQEKNGQLVEEKRFFQMISYSKKFKKSPIVLVASSTLEERHLSTNEQFSLRLKEVLKVSARIYKTENLSMSLFFQDEYYVRLNDSHWAGKKGFDQNYMQVGLDIAKKTKYSDSQLSLGYTRLTTPSNDKNIFNVKFKYKFPSKNKKK